MCNSCFRDDKINTSTTFTVEYKGCIIVIKNVPCLECQICGETTFSDEVSERLEKLVNSVKSVLQEVSVIDYLKVA
ncbi:MAG: type II toxin-antitoxin system MqsA family antitoxin [Lachnospiraceae bacterium]|nr:type II toxin-antitoxin system MqsA family antitoxin [Lachnospiraceae bacterium]